MFDGLRQLDRAMSFDMVSYLHGQNPSKTPQAGRSWRIQIDPNLVSVVRNLARRASARLHGAYQKYMPETRNQRQRATTFQSRW